MCGIVGVIGKIGKAERDVFKQLLIVDSLRGPDSTGFINAKGNRTDYFKKAGDPYFVMESRRFDTELLKPSNVLIGHNRWATVGAVNTMNAHPFDFDNVIGVHNGTLRNKHALLDSHKFVVDSENLYHAINVDGVHNTIPKVEGAWSLVWWDKKEQKVNFLRNEERPMAMCVSTDKKTLFFASEVGMLLWILARNGIKHEPIVLTSVDHLYTLKVKDEFEGVATPLNDFEITKLEGKPKQVFQNVHAGNAANVGGRFNRTIAADYVNRKFEFEVEAPYVNPEGARFIMGKLTDGSNISVIVSVEEDKAFEEELMAFKDDHIFEAYGQAVRYSGGGSLLLARKSSVLAIPLYDEDDEEDAAEDKVTANVVELKPNPKLPAYPGFENRALSMIEWRDLTAVGCVFCCEIPTDKDKYSIKWIDARHHVCAGCKDLDSVKPYIQH